MRLREEFIESMEGPNMSFSEAIAEIVTAFAGWYEATEVNWAGEQEFIDIYGSVENAAKEAKEEILYYLTSELDNVIR